MWHEEKEEMINLIDSLIKLDKEQRTLKRNSKNYFQLEGTVIF